MKLSRLFERCLHIPYRQAENAANYATERIGSVLYIYFEGSDGLTDWKNNLDFPAKPYRRMGETVWFAHRGFLRVWKSIRDVIADDISDPSVKKIILAGYSHGAAIAALCHEYVWYHRQDLRNGAIEGYGFGCPRVFWGFQTEPCRQRWANFQVIRNLNDIVTHLPPAVFGFSHVGELLEIGERGKYSMIDAHRQENLLAELRRYESSVPSPHTERVQIVYASSARPRGAAPNPVEETFPKKVSSKSSKTFTQKQCQKTPHFRSQP